MKSSFHRGQYSGNKIAERLDVISTKHHLFATKRPKHDKEEAMTGLSFHHPVEMKQKTVVRVTAACFSLCRKGVAV